MTAPVIADLMAELDRECLPHLSVNAVIFGADHGRLKVLGIRSAGMGRWSLPGGYVRRTESIDDTASRIAHEITGLENIALRQFHTFGGPARGEAVVADALRAHGASVPADHWALGRVVSVGYVALIDATRASLSPTRFAEAIEWHDVEEHPPLIIDHDEMVRRALASLRAQVDAMPIDAQVLPVPFTMPELQRIHEVVLGRPLDRRNFQKRMIELGRLERLPELRTGRRCKPTYVYRWAQQSA